LKRFIDIFNGKFASVKFAEKGQNPRGFCENKCTKRGAGY
jgi:hypothetical protein